MVAIDLNRLTRGDDSQRALVLPGARYPVDLPGLAWPVRALELTGWQVWCAAWDLWEVEARARRQAAVQHGIDLFLDAVGERPQLVIAKSVGTYAADWVADNQVPAVWSTPLLVDAGCVDAIGRSPAPALLVAGSRDDAWDDAAAAATGKEVCVVPDADHGWRTGAWRTELDALSALTGAVERFAAPLVP